MLMAVSSCDVNACDNDHTTPLIMAAMSGNKDVCESLISRGADIELKDVNEMTALIWAAAEGHVEIASMLIKVAQKHRGHAKYYIEQCDNEGNTALHMAVQNGSLKVVQLLIAEGANVNCKKNNLSTPLHLAASCGFLEIAKLLVASGVELNSPDIDHLTPVHRAAIYNKVDIVQFLIAHGGNVNAKDKKNMLPLHCASWKGQTESVEFLLKNGANLTDVDTSLKTALHWIVQFSHFETLMMLLLHGGKFLVNYRDKNDQTPLHYAAYTGNTSILKILIDSGANTDAKDQEERSPLHIAAQYGNISCVEVLMQVSNRETNDDDIDGRTPLLLASLNGHHHVVQMLLALGGDVTVRDDEHCTALMLAATSGHTFTMKVLLDNHANVNEADKMKNTALHYACAGGHVEAVQLLLDKRADVTFKNAHEQAPLDLAIDNQHGQVLTVMLTHSSWRNCMGVRGAEGRSPLDRLIAKMPDAALIVLDHCIEKSSRDEDDPKLTMTLDYQYIDPGPDDISSSRNRYFALQTMVRYERDVLLSHPLCQHILAQKWVKFGRILFYGNLCTYIGYLLCLTLYVNNIEGAELLDARHGCPIQLNESMRRMLDTDEKRHEYRRSANVNISDHSLISSSHTTEVLGGFLIFFVIIFLLRDVAKIFSQRWKYFINFYNAIVWTLMISTTIFIIPPSPGHCLLQWRAGWISLFLAWINLIMYLRRIDFVGIYVIMFVTVLISMLKVVLVFLLFCLAFAGAFFIVLPGESVFNGLGVAMLNIFVMTIGEIEFVDSFLPLEEREPFTIDSMILLTLFVFLMPIVLMNLMIGVAVGDIEKIQLNAYLKRIGLQVDLLYNIENSLPKPVQKRVYAKINILKPNEPSKNCMSNMGIIGRVKMQGFQVRESQFIALGEKDKMINRIEKLKETLHSQQQDIRNLQSVVNQQMTLLYQIAGKLDIGVPHLQQHDRGNIYSSSPGGSTSHAEGLGERHVHLVPPRYGPQSDEMSLGIERNRQRSVRQRSLRQGKSERPPSVVI